MNQKRVLKEIWLNEGISRIEISDSLNLDKSTITNIVSDLLSRGLISEVEEGEAGPQGGRKPIKLKIRKNFCCVLGIEVQPEYCNIVCVNLSGEMLLYKKIEKEISAYDFHIVFKEILAEVENKLGKLKIPLAGIGVGLSGIVNPDEGLLYESIPLGVSEGFRIADLLSAYTDVPVIIDNDANCCCWGEKVFNKEEELQNFIFPLVEFRKQQSVKPTYGGVAVGFGIVIGGKVHYGNRYAAGEFRSIFVEHGRAGQLSLGSEKEVDVKKDPELFRKFEVELSKNIALLVNTFALSDCFIGGDLEEHKESFGKILKDEIDHNWNYPGESPCRIRFSSLNEKAVAYGAAAMLIERLFDAGSSGIKNLLLDE